jgi:hypothetical protein
MSRKLLLQAAAILALSIGPAIAQGRFGGPAASNSTTVTNATGTISQLNYGPGGNVQGFLIGTNTLLLFPGDVTGGVGSLGAAGNSVTYSGTAFTSSSGFESVRVTSFTNNTTKATFTAPTSSSSTYGPTSGTLKQLNYGPGGGIDGFVFSAGGSTVLVTIGPQPSNSTLTPLLTVGATVSVTGNSRTNSTAGALTVVHATSITVASQTFMFNGGGPGFGGGGGRGRGR